MNVRAVSKLLFSVFSAAMLGLAAGAVWMVISLYLRHGMPWLALPIGAVLAWAIRHGVCAPGRGSALLTIMATALAVVYVNMLIAAVRIAGNMGLGLIEALRTAGAGMLWQLAHMALTPTDFISALLGMLLGAWLAWRKR